MAYARNVACVLTVPPRRALSLSDGCRIAMKNGLKKETGSLGDSAGLPGWRRWIFRLVAMVAVPMVLVALFEVALRIVGYGYPTGFFLPAWRDGREVLEQNNRFGWRFFGPKLARLPNPFSISRVKGTKTQRIFVFGESAAKGDPQPQFGLTRMLDALLSMRHPGIRFEVVNTAMTAINSHVIVPTARDCAGADGDVWVVYMGNNEVVGPFGAGTVFGRQTPPLPLIRAQMALKTTRAGQWLDATARAVGSSANHQGEWHGMSMFLEHEVSADDPRMGLVYHHFSQNFANIVTAGEHCGAGIVLSTVAVNLRDCPPFASQHRPGLSAADRIRWDDLYKRGGAAADAGKKEEAAVLFRQAAQLDDRFAELRFREGECALALGRTAEAQAQFRAARELDTLRFRCDSRLNELIRQAAGNRLNERVLLADAEKTFAEQSVDGLPGDELFYEHVHLTFDGNYLLARTIAAQVEKLLPATTASNDAETRAWPSAADCARRLGWTDWSRLAGLNEMSKRLKESPFTSQLHHDARISSLRAATAQLAPAAQPAGISNALQVCQAALAANPDDPPLLSLLASLQRAAGNRVAAVASARREVELLPNDSEGWQQLALILIQQQQGEDAAEALRRAAELDPQNAQLVYERGQILRSMGHSEEAIREYRHALALQAHFGLAWIGLGEAYEKMGRHDTAGDCFREALAHNAYRGEAAELARFCQSRGWLEAARTNFNQAILEDPADATTQLQAGQNAWQLGRYVEAAEHFGEAARLEPELEEAHFSYGSALGQSGKDAEAADELRVALRLNPNHVEARLNLGVALIKLGRYSEAHAELEETVRECPTNALALQYLQKLRPVRAKEN
jgi:tetratricopeptide (TPR) repeat protein